MDTWPTLAHAGGQLRRISLFSRGLVDQRLVLYQGSEVLAEAAKTGLRRAIQADPVSTVRTTLWVWDTRIIMEIIHVCCIRHHAAGAQSA